MNKVGIIGAGNLGKSLARGWVKYGDFKPNDIGIYRRNLLQLQKLTEEGFDVKVSNQQLVEEAEIVVLAVLPQQIDALLHEIKDYLKPYQILVSLVTGVSIQNISEKLHEHNNIVRAMPNTAISIGQSMTCLTALDKESTILKSIKTLFDQVGVSIIINEHQMTSATALCACGTAFFLRAIRAAMQGGTEIDFHAEDALLMAAQTAKGAAMLLLENKTHPEQEIDRVTSPKGCTIAGLNHMEHSGFSSAFIKGITTSAEKARNLY
jgi:pyrroline-5-carboxylate reductase